jgi:hypothetical protein
MTKLKNALTLFITLCLGYIAGNTWPTFEVKLLKDSALPAVSTPAMANDLIKFDDEIN